MDNYKAAKYMRLSREDGDDRESESIENQRDIIDNYIKDHCELKEVNEYVDDGFTGTNFNRPGFQKMLKDIQDNKINCIITKDLSRFGRDHIDTGYYLERFFPSNQIRYIAIGDNVDTLKTDGLQFLTFKLSFNDYYAQDISNKIKSVKERKIEKGEFQGGIPPYGYKKDKKIKNHLVIDTYSANIVKEIYDMYINKGMSTIKIADELNRRKILPPAVYLKIPTYIKRKSKNTNGQYVWLRTQIGKILKNEVYIGSVVGRKYIKVSHKIAKIRMTKDSEHIIVKNMHTPIIDVETWNKVQDKIKNKNSSRQRKYDHILKGLVFCKECGSIATIRCRTEKRKSGKIWQQYYFICSKRNNNTGLCDCKQIKASILEECIKDKLEAEFKKIKYSYNGLEEILIKSKNKLMTQKEDLKQTIKIYEEKINLINKTLEELYEDKVNEVITIKDFETIYKNKNNEKNKIINEIKNIQSQVDDFNKKIIEIDNSKIIEQVRTQINLNNIHKEVYKMLIDKIEFDKDNNINIKFKFNEKI